MIFSEDFEWFVENIDLFSNEILRAILTCTLRPRKWGQSGVPILAF
jgi:hypothetical protein